MDENKLLIKNLEEKYTRFSDYYMLMHSDFLSMEQQSIASGIVKQHEKEGVMFFGGYEDADRKQVYFVPDYTDAADERELIRYFAANPAECPLAVLKVHVPRAERGRLGHRDYLGALMGEGIKREKIGDIIVRDDGAQIIAAREMVEYLAGNLSQVGRVSVKAEATEISQINAGEIRKKVDKFTVSSPRVDNIVSAIFGVSRKDAVEAVSRGRVFVGGVEISKPDMVLKGGEKVVLRGKGKAVYLGETGTSRKGKTYIEAEIYI